jgi:hypothetical protein
MTGRKLRGFKFAFISPSRLEAGRSHRRHHHNPGIRNAARTYPEKRAGDWI